MASLPSSDAASEIQDIQELRRVQPTAIPARYIRDSTERPAADEVLASLRVPVIDLSKLVRGGRRQSQEEMARLCSACEEWGFFQVINHGIEQGLLDSMETLAKEFFMLPLEEKEKYPMAPGTIQGYGHAFVFSEDQKLDWCNMLALGVEPAFIRKPHLWPAKPASLRCYSNLPLFLLNRRKSFNFDGDRLRRAIVFPARHWRSTRAA